MELLIGLFAGLFIGLVCGIDCAAYYFNQQAKKHRSVVDPSDLSLNDRN